MDLTPATIAAIQTTFSQQFRAAYGTAPVFWSSFSTQIPSSVGTNTYGWMKRLPKLREWVGPRVLQNVAAQSYQLTNKDWELTVGVGRNDIDDDTLGIYNPIVADMGRAAAKWPDQLARDALQAGTTDTSFDGLPFFDTAHTLDPAATQSNNLTGALSAATFETARETMAAYKGEDGEPLGVMPDLLIVPPQLEATAKRIVSTELVQEGGAGVSNVNRGAARVLMIPELSNEATTWYLADTSRPIKPLLFQLRKAPQMNALTAPTMENLWAQREYKWGVDSRGVFGYTLWFLMTRNAP